MYLIGCVTFLLPFDCGDTLLSPIAGLHEGVRIRIRLVRYALNVPVVPAHDQPAHGEHRCKVSHVGVVLSQNGASSWLPGLNGILSPGLGCLNPGGGNGHTGFVILFLG